MKDLYAHMGQPQRDTMVANTTRSPSQTLETTDNKQPVPRGVPAVARPERGTVEPPPPRPVSKHPALGAPYRSPIRSNVPTVDVREFVAGLNDPPEGTGVGEVKPGGIKVR